MNCFRYCFTHPALHVSLQEKSGSVKTAAHQDQPAWKHDFKQIDCLVAKLTDIVETEKSFHPRPSFYRLLSRISFRESRDNDKYTYIQLGINEMGMGFS